MHSPLFFHDEIRNGFYIPSAIKVSWAATLDVLAEIDRICKKHDITYFADWGSFLGAVRHGGIIPWDDDVDICMKRADYEKFRSVVDSELKEGFVIHDYERQSNHWLFLSRIVNSSRIRFDADYLNSHYNHPWLSGVDIFVKDYQYRDPVKNKKQVEDILFILAVADGIRTEQLSGNSLDNSLSEIRDRFSLSLNPADDRNAIAVALYKLAEKHMSLAPDAESDVINQVFPWVLNGRPGDAKECYDSASFLPFEDTYIPVPVMYNKVLSERYGNYLAIHKSWDGHEYPVFDHQRKLFEETTGTVLHRYSFDENLMNRSPIDDSSSLKTLAKETLGELNNLCTRLQALPQSVSESESDLVSILGDMQQLAADLGTLMEAVKGEDAPTTKSVVSVLEALCEQVYTCHQSITESGDFSDIANLSDTLSKLSDALDQNLFSRKEALFLPVGPKEWAAFDDLYKAESEDKNTDVFVVPLPLFMKDCYGNVISNGSETEALLEADKYPEYVQPADFNAYNPSLHCPDRVYIQNPYDGENPCLTVPPQFYSGALRQFTPELIYTPIGKTAEFTEADGTDQICMGFYVPMPGIAYADKVYLQSENIRKQYLNKLTDWAGPQTRDYWTAKLKVHAAAPEQKETSKTKKKLLFCISSYEYYEHKDNFSSGLEKRLASVKEHSGSIDLVLCTYPPINYEDSDKAFFEIVSERAKDAGIPILDYTIPDVASLSCEFDVYYGSSSPFVPAFAGKKKPVMISNYDV